MKKLFFKALSVLLCIAMLTGFMPFGISAEEENEKKNAETVIDFDDSQITDGEFFIPERSITFYENGSGACISVLRTGDSLPEAKIRLVFTDYSAEYGKDYSVRIIGNGEIHNEGSSESIMNVLMSDPDSIEEYNTADSIIDGTAEKERELNDDDIDQLNEIANEVLTPGQEKTKDSTREVTPSALKDAKTEATGIVSDKMPMDGTGASYSPSLGFLDDSIGELNEALGSVYLLLYFEEGQNEVQIEITPIDNSDGEGNKTFAVTLGSEGDSVISELYKGSSIQITDDEEYESADISFSSASYSPENENTYVSVILERSGNMTDTVSVLLDTENITAEAGRDYSQVSSEIVFPFGIAKRTINIPVSGEYLEEDATFALNITPKTGCTAKNISRAEVLLPNETPAFLMGEAITTSSNVTGKAFEYQQEGVEHTYCHSGNSKSYINFSGTAIKMHLEDKTFNATKTAKVNINFGEHWDYKGFEVEWSRSSGKPNYGSTFLYNYDITGKEYKIYTTSSERWGTRTESSYTDNDKNDKNSYSMQTFMVRLDRGKGIWGTSPTLDIASVKPVLRPFKITLQGADPIYVYDYDKSTGKYEKVKNTSVAGLTDGNKVLLEGATNTGTGYLTTITGTDVSVRMYNLDGNIAYIKGVKLINEKTNESVLIADNLPVGTTDYSFTLTNDFLKDYISYINFEGTKSESYGYFKIQPVLGNIPSKISVTANENVSLRIRPNGIINRGDCVIADISVKNPIYSCNKIEIIPDSGSGIYYLQAKEGEKSVSFRAEDAITIAPYVEKGGNRLTVKVAEADSAKFDTAKGIFNSPYTLSEDGKYRFYTIIGEKDFSAGEYVEMTASTADDAYVSTWKEPASGNTYAQNTFYFETRATGPEDNLLELKPAYATGKLPLSAKGYYNDTAIGDWESPEFWLPATGLSLMLDKTHYGLIDENGKMNSVGDIPFVGGCCLRLKMTSNGNVSYKEKKIASNSKSINFGTITVTPIFRTVPHIDAVTVENSNGVLLSTVPIDDTAVTTLRAHIDNDGSSYKDSDGITHDENVKKVEFLVYDMNHQFKTSLEMKGKDSEMISSIISEDDTYMYVAAFARNHRTEYESSDILYVRVTTDRWIGNGCIEDEDGNQVPADVMRETVYAPVRTRFVFAENNPEIMRPFDFDIATEGKGFTQLPIIGDLQVNFCIKKFNFNIQPIANGIRLCVGYIPKSWSDGQHVNGDKDPLSDTGEAYSSPKDFKTAFGDMKDVIEGGGKNLFPHGPQYLGMVNWTIKPYVGLYLDFGLHYEIHDGITTNQFVFLGGGGYIGIAGMFRYTFYMLIYGVPCYTGFDVTLTVLGQFGAAAQMNDETTYDAIISGSTSLADFDFDTMITAELDVNAYIGVGVCGTAGVRGGVSLSIYFAYYPVVNKFHPEFRKTGWWVTGTIKVWVDVVLMSIPIPCWKFLNERFGYFKDIHDYNEKINTPDVSYNDTQVLEVQEKARANGLSTWLGSTPTLQSTLSPISSKVLLKDGYDDPSIREKAFDSNGDGKNDKVIMAFLDDDKNRESDQRTALMYSIYDVESGLWSEPVMIQDDGTADLTPDLCLTKNGIQISWASREPSYEMKSNADRLKSLEIYTCNYSFDGTLGEIVRLTDDDYFDISPYAVADEKTGDILVHYTKSAVPDELTSGQDVIRAGWTLYNEGEQMYMLFDGKSGEWVFDRYFENELAEGADTEKLLHDWNGQRFLSTPIEGGMSDPVISDFHASSIRLGFYPSSDELFKDTGLDETEWTEILTSENELSGEQNSALELLAEKFISYYESSEKDYGVYAYSIDMDNNLDTKGDTEMFIQIYDFESHKTTSPIRLTYNNLYDSEPWIKGDYLFWTQGEGCAKFIDLRDAISSNLDIVDGEIVVRDTIDSYTESSGTWKSGTVDVKRFSDGSGIPQINSYVPFVDADGHIFIVWQEVSPSDGGHSPELYVTSLTYDENGNEYWSDANRLTNSDSFEELPVVVSIDEETLLMVGNQYDIDMDSDTQTVENVRIVATTLKSVSSLDADIEVRNDAFEVITSGSADRKDDGECKVGIIIRNTGLRSSESFEYSAQLLENSIPVGEKTTVTKSFLKDGTLLPAGGSFTDEITFKGLDKLDLAKYSVKVTYKEGEYDEEVKEFPLFDGKPSYVVSGIESDQSGNGWDIRGYISNFGSAESSKDDIVKFIFNDLYMSGYEETFAEINLDELLQIEEGEHLGVTESRPFLIHLPVSPKIKESGFVNACVIFTDADGKRVGSGEDFILQLEHPFDVTVDNLDEYGGLSMKEGESTVLSGKYGGSGLFGGGEILYSVEDPDIAVIENGILTALGEGDTTVEMTVYPYGGVGSFRLNVKENDSSAVFEDVKTTAYYFDSVNWAASSGITLGTDDTHFSPNAECTRAMAVTLLYRAAGSPEAEGSADKFNDVKSGAYYEKALIWAIKNGITSGTSDTTFSPNDPCTRAQMISFLARYVGIKEKKAKTVFDDVNPDAYYSGYVDWAWGTDVCRGTDETHFSPGKKCTRAEMITFMYRYFSR